MATVINLWKPRWIVRSTYLIAHLACCLAAWLFVAENDPATSSDILREDFLL
ncbi:MAG: hypothetical protein UZ02_AOB001001601 [Nitrosomonas europaea]|nr:MAG: hypothetical protein UZ02_AOB001001601 [Nitrosomonas europaea]